MCVARHFFLSTGRLLFFVRSFVNVLRFSRGGRGTFHASFTRARMRRVRRFIECEYRESSLHSLFQKCRIRQIRRLLIFAQKYENRCLKQSNYWMN